jgi:hypothetical protein
MVELCIVEQKILAVSSVTLVPSVIQASRILTTEDTEDHREMLASVPSGYFLSAFTISRAALAPDPPVSPVPGWVPLPHR